MREKKAPMKWYKKIWLIPMLLLNLCASATLLLCTFSQQLPSINMRLVSLVPITGLAFPIALAVVVAFLMFWLFAWRKGLWLSLVTLLVCTSSIRDMCPVNFRRQTPPSGAFHVLSYNICSTNVPAEGRIDTPTLDYLLRSNADIICLQECNVGSMRNIDKRSATCRAYPYRSHVILGHGTRSHNLCCLSKFPIVDIQDIGFDGSGNGALRCLLLVEGDTLALFNCHLQSFGLDDDDKNVYEEIFDDPRNNLPTARTKDLVKKLRDASARRSGQADDIARRIEETGARYTIVCGDFNDTPVSYAHHRLTRLLTDAHTRSGNGFDFSFTQGHMYFRIDHILASKNLHPWRCRVHHDITYSDHHPISTYFTIGEE